LIYHLQIFDDVRHRINGSFMAGVFPFHVLDSLSIYPVVQVVIDEFEEFTLVRFEAV
jgi:hypothetical protein